MGDNWVYCSDCYLCHHGDCEEYNRYDGCESGIILDEDEDEQKDENKNEQPEN